MRLYLLSLLPLLLTLATPALAVDGVLEINQTCAVQTGCFAGDTAGLPVTITTSGSYRLTSNLDIPDIDTSGIVVNANDVGIDLNNFAIIGPVVCTTTSSTLPATCPAPGTGSGIVGVDGSTRYSGTSVKNGSVRGMGRMGVWLGHGAEVINVRATWNPYYGINVGQGSVLSGNTASQNERGISSGQGSTVTGNTATRNTEEGLMPSASTVVGNASSYNGGYGIRVDGGATVSGNTVIGNASSGGIDDDQQGGTVVSGNAVSGNGEWGIRVGAGSIVSGNSVTGNASDGINATGGGCRISGNALRGNGTTYGGSGLNIDAESTYRDNTITNNITGAVTGGGVNMGDNYCAGTGVNLSTCP